MEERRSGGFTQKISLIVICIAGLGGTYVLADPVFTLVVYGQEVKFGGEGFSEQLKGAVVQTLLIGGWTTVLAFWIGASASGNKQGESVARIAEQSAPVAASAVAASRNGGAQTEPIKADSVTVEGDNVVVSEKKP